MSRNGKNGEKRRPMRPSSVAAAAEKDDRKMETIRLSIPADAKHALRLGAVQSDLTMAAYLVKLLRDSGADVAEFTG